MAKLCRKLKWLVFFSDTVYTARVQVQVYTVHCTYIVNQISYVNHLCCYLYCAQIKSSNFESAGGVLGKGAGSPLLTS